MNGQPWTEEQLRVVRELYAGTATRKLAERIGRGVGSVHRKAAELGLRKSAEFLRSAESGILRKGESRPGCVATQFRKGQVPVNKGLRRPGWAPGRMAETQFKPGERRGIAARNWRPVGSIAEDLEGYLRIKVRDALAGEATGFGNVKVWPLMQRHVWEKECGPIPKGHVIAFRDGNKQNVAIGNLECISRAELARRNSMWTVYPRELAVVVHLTGQLGRKIRRLERGKESTE